MANAKPEPDMSQSPDETPSRDSLDEVRRFIETSGKDLDRLIVIRPGRPDDVPYLEKLYQHFERPVPAALQDWVAREDGWCDEYLDQFAEGALLEINLKIAIYLFDQTFERVILAYGISSPQLHARDSSRMRRFPDVNVGVRAVLGEEAFLADRGHFLGHAAGGELDINLFPQRRELNRGWSAEGKVFRAMERYAASHTGTFIYHRATYNDETWIPDSLEYGVLKQDKAWWIERFRNK